MVSKAIRIGHLYPRQMNVYGDMGNVITLRYRLEARGFKVQYLPMESLELLKNDAVDILVGGGGQDSNQLTIQKDLLKHSAELKARCQEGLTGLMVCGLYQLFGNRFVLGDGSEMRGSGVFDLETIAGADRLIGNVVIDSEWGRLVGFENHSGRTYLNSGVTALGKLIKGSGNNGEDKTEGVVVNNMFGTYMHGPVLAKNPILADELIRRCLQEKGENGDLAILDDSLEYAAATEAAKRPR